MLNRAAQGGNRCSLRSSGKSRLWRESHRYIYIVSALGLHLLPASAAGQGVLEGAIRNAATGAPLAGAQVAITPLGLGGITDRAGASR